MDSRNENRSGNRLPSTTTAAAPASSAIAHGDSSCAGPISPCTPNRNSVEKIMKMFHSSGTPIGNVVRMCRWNTTITTTATARTVRFAAVTSTNGTTNSIAVPTRASSVLSPDGRRSSGKCRYMRRLSVPDMCSGALLIMMETTNGKCRFSFDVAAPHHSSSIPSCAAASICVAGRKNSTVARK